MIEYPYTTEIKVEQIVPNLWNPNVMSDEEFEMLEDNIRKVGFLDPILVVPVESSDGDLFRIVDGEHRFEAQRILGLENVPCIVADPMVFDETTQKLQTVRMNQIRGGHDITKFNNLVNDLVSNHDIPFETVASELGFADVDEFNQLVEATRRSLPQTPGLKQEFDKKVKDIQNYDDLVKLVEKLYHKFGSTLPANFMVMDFGRQHNLLVKMQPGELNMMLNKFRECLDSGYTVDSLMVHIFRNLDVISYIQTHADKLTTVPEEGADIEQLHVSDTQEIYLQEAQQIS